MRQKLCGVAIPRIDSRSGCNNAGVIDGRERSSGQCMTFSGTKLDSMQCCVLLRPVMAGGTPDPVSRDACRLWRLCCG
jgi:hypothetical protein